MQNCTANIKISCTMQKPTWLEIDCKSSGKRNLLAAHEHSRGDQDRPPGDDNVQHRTGPVTSLR